MAYTIILTKDTVSKHKNGIYTISIKAVVNDGVDDVMDIIISGKYNSNAPDLAATMSELQKQFMSYWDKYVAENNVHNSAVLDATVITLQSQAQTYINQ
jgi:hypothetical protein